MQKLLAQVQADKAVTAGDKSGSDVGVQDRSSLAQVFVCFSV